MRVKRLFLGDSDRYRFDLGECCASKGWAQVDTWQDAWYFGMWANPQTLEIVSYAEGDYTKETADDAAEFIQAVLKIKEWADESSANGFKGIDCMCSPTTEKRFKGLGLGELLH